jgi:hypothetical protein
VREAKGKPARLGLPTEQGKGSGGSPTVLVDGEVKMGWCGRKVVDGEGVDVDELRAHAVLLEVVVGPKVHER